VQLGLLVIDVRASVCFIYSKQCIGGGLWLRNPRNPAELKLLFNPSLFCAFRF